MKIPDSILTQIIERIDPIAIVGEYVTLKKKGKNYWGLCPFHTEKTPSFNVSPENGMFYCYGCHKGGSIFNFIMEIEGVSFIEAVKMLAEKAGVTIDVDSRTVSGEEKLKLAILELNKRVAKSFNYILLNNQKANHALSYLFKRKITKETIELFNIGYAPRDRSWLLNFLLKKNYSTDFLIKSGLFLRRNGRVFPYFSDRVIFPIYNNRGDVVGFGGRTLSDMGPKYLNTPETEVFHKKFNVFGLYQALKEIKNKNEFVLVEGYIDVLLMHQAGIQNTVAPLGTAFTENQAYTLKRYADNAVLAFDGDEAGKKATIRTIGILEKVGINSGVVVFPNSMDPADFFEKEGFQKLQKLIEYNINSFQYLLDYEISKHNVETPEGKKRIAESIYSYIDITDSNIKKEGYLNLLAEKLGIDNRAVYNDFIRWQNKFLRKRSSHNTRRGEETLQGRSVSAELYFLLFVIANREYFEQVRKIVTENDFSDRWARDIFIALEESYRDEEETLEGFLERLSNNELKNLIARKITSGEFSVNVEKAIQDGIKNIKRSSLERRRKEVIRLLKTNGNKNSNIDTRTLLEEKMFLDKELEKLKVR